MNSRRYAASCGDAPAHAHVLQLVRLPGWPLTERAANFTHTSSHAIDDAAPIMLVTFRLEVAWYSSLDTKAFDNGKSDRLTVFFVYVSVRLWLR